MDAEKAKNEIQKLGRMLCEVCRSYEREFCDIGEWDDHHFSDELIEWWRDHGQLDKKRLEYEELLAKAEKKVICAISDLKIGKSEVELWKKKLKELGGSSEPKPPSEQGVHLRRDR